MQIIAHRGARAVLQENTMKAFERAVELDADALEADILVTKDQRCVVRHDNFITIKEQQRYIHDLSLNELQQVDLGEGERIPSLEDFLECFADRIPVVLDIKQVGVTKLITQNVKLPKRVHFTSFLFSEIAYLRKHQPDVACSLNLAAVFPNLEAIFKQARILEVGIYRGYVTEELVRQLKASQIKVRAYTVNWLEEARLFSNWGVHAIYTDEIAAMKAL